MGKKVFLGGLSWASTPESLCNFFTNLDFEVEKAVIICDKPTGKSRGFGFMVFADSCPLDQLQSHYKVDGRLVEVKTALRKHEIVSPVKTQTKIFVGGIPQEVTWEELQNYFSQFGEIVGGQIMIDKKTKRSRGFGFVKFLHEESVELAFNIDHYIHFKRIEIKIAETNPKTPLHSASVSDNSFENSFDTASFEGTNSCDSISYCENIWVNPNVANNMSLPLSSQKKQPALAPRDESRSQESHQSHTPGRSGASSLHVPSSFMSAVSNSCGGDREVERSGTASYSERSGGSPSNSYPYRGSSDGSYDSVGAEEGDSSSDESREEGEEKESKIPNNKHANNNYNFDQQQQQQQQQLNYLNNANNSNSPNLGDLNLNGGDFSNLLNFNPNFISASNPSFSPLTLSDDRNTVAPISPKSIRRFFFINQKNDRTAESGKKSERATTSSPSAFKTAAATSDESDANSSSGNVIVNANIIGAIKQHHQQQHHHVQQHQQLTQQQIQQQQQQAQQQQQKQQQKQQQQQQKQQDRVVRQKRQEERQRQQMLLSTLKSSLSTSSLSTNSSSKSLPTDNRTNQERMLHQQEQERQKRHNERLQKQQQQEIFKLSLYGSAPSSSKSTSTADMHTKQPHQPHQQQYQPQPQQQQQQQQQHVSQQQQQQQQQLQQQLLQQQQLQQQMQQQQHQRRQQLQQQGQQQQQPHVRISPPSRQYPSDFLSLASTSSGLQLSPLRSSSSSYENNNNVMNNNISNNNNMINNNNGNNNNNVLNNNNNTNVMNNNNNGNNNAINNNNIPTLFHSPNHANKIAALNLSLLNFDDFGDLGLTLPMESPIPMEKHIEPSLMTQLNWDSETFVPTEQEKLKIGAPIFKMKNKYL
jgi:RNA recognition motif-containing protein